MALSCTTAGNTTGGMVSGACYCMMYTALHGMYWFCLTTRQLGGSSVLTNRCGLHLTLLAAPACMQRRCPVHQPARHKHSGSTMPALAESRHDSQQPSAAVACMPSRHCGQNAHDPGLQLTTLNVLCHCGTRFHLSSL